MTKQDIRKKILEKMDNLPKSWVMENSRKIHRRLAATAEFQRAGTIMFYITKDNEVDTNPMIKHALRRGKTICAPCVDKVNHKLHPAIIKDLEKDLVKGNYCILEPSNRDNKPRNIDLIITPGLAFDIHGHRLGRGKAYYDRFLEKKRDIPKIGLAFDFQILDKLPVDSHDIPMDKIITERRTINSNKQITMIK